MKRLALISVFFLLLSACATPKPEEQAELECIVAVEGTKFVSFFPVKDTEQKIWAWNTKRPMTDDDVFDYSWIGEPGNIDKGGAFIPDIYAFGAAHINSSHNLEAKGSLADVVKDHSDRANIYFNSPNRDARAEADRWMPRILMPTLYHEDGIMIYSRDPRAIQILLGKRPTHAKLKVKTPYPSQSYECITPIQYLEDE